MAIKTYGKLSYLRKPSNDYWLLQGVPPHVLIRLKLIFQGIPKNSANHIEIRVTNSSSQDIEWFEARYPMIMDRDDRGILHGQANNVRNRNDDIELMLKSGRPPIEYKLKKNLRNYQQIAVNLFSKVKRLLISDDVGLGKTIEAIGAMTISNTLPVLVVCYSHLGKQWVEAIEEFLGATTHIIKNTKPYVLPSADVYITTYHKLSGWSDIIRGGFFKMIVYDEVQELRRCESARWEAASTFPNAVEYIMGTSATPIYNYGNEIFNVMECINPGCLGGRSDFLREWCQSYGRIVNNPIALGTFLRDEHLMLRRTKKDVGRELPPVNPIIEYVEHKHKDEQKVTELAVQLAQRVGVGSFIERGMASREFSTMLRMSTGVGKARSVANYVRILLDSGLPILLTGWHREVYDIWLEELSDFNPVMYTGSESPNQKQKSKEMFLSGDTNLLIMSLRSAVGVEGLQKRCSTVVFGELDYSPKVHEQIIGRLDRDGQEESVTALHLISNWGTDPFLIDILGVKAAQSEGIMNPFDGPKTVHSDRTFIESLAKDFLRKHGKRS